MLNNPRIRFPPGPDTAGNPAACQWTSGRYSGSAVDYLCSYGRSHPMKPSILRRASSLWQRCCFRRYCTQSADGACQPDSVYGTAGADSRITGTGILALSIHHRKSTQFNHSRVRENRIISSMSISWNWRQYLLIMILCFMITSLNSRRFESCPLPAHGLQPR